MVKVKQRPRNFLFIDVKIGGLIDSQIGIYD